MLESVRSTGKPRPGRGWIVVLRLALLGCVLAGGVGAPQAARAGLASAVRQGELSVQASAGEPVTIACLNRQVAVNGAAPQTGPAACDQITAVSVLGGSAADQINLAGLLPEAFPALQRVEVLAGGGADVIYASPFADRLDGGPGDDTFVGAAAGDQVVPGAGTVYYLEATEPLWIAPQTPPQDLPAEPAGRAPLSSALSASIEGINFNEDATNSGFYHIPPDPSGAAGPAHVVSVNNTSIEWHTKAGVQQNSQRLGRNSTTAVGSFFESLTPVNGLYDPKVIYDQFASRFVVVAQERRDTANGDPVNSSRILLAVSDDSDPNGTWYFHAIDSLVNISGSDTWADYPGFSVDEEAVYVTSNMFTFGAGSNLGSRLWIINKTPFYTGGAASVAIYDPATASGIGSTTMQPAHIFGTAPAGVGTWLVRYSGYTDGTNEFLSVIRVDDPLAAPTFTHQFISMGNVDNTVASHANAPQSGTATLVNTNDRRALHAVWRNNALWTTFSLVPGSGADSGQVTAHWAKVDTTTLAALVVTDQGNAGGEDIAAGTYTFFPSIAVDACGNMALGFAASAATIFPGAYYTQRYASDAAGTVQSSGTLAAGLDFYIRTFGSGRNRWGDYSGISLDPANEATFWLYNQYALTRGTVFGGEDGRWGSRFGSFVTGIDFGDLPAGYNLTLFANDAARHCLSALRLGSLVDADGDGQPNATATGDDANGDDEDGVTAVGNWADGAGEVLVTSSGGRACLSGWLDYWNGTTFGGDNDFGDAGEQVIFREAFDNNTRTLTFSLPAGASLSNPTFRARFRLVPDQDNDGDCTDQADILPTGLQSGGEVEDYEFNFNPTAVNLSAFQAHASGSARPAGLLAAALGLGLMVVTAVWSRRRRRLGR